MTWTTCDRCKKEARRVVGAYWGQSLCPRCAHEVAEMHDLLGTWPAVPNQWKAA